MTPPTRPQPPLIDDGYLVEPEPPTLVGFDPALTADQTAYVLRDPDGKLHVLRAQPRRRRLGCSIWPFLVGLGFWLVLAALATPRSGQTTGPVDVSGISSAAQSGAPQPLTAGVRNSVGSGPRPAASGERTGSGAPQARAKTVPASPPGRSSAISSGLASWYPARGDVASVPWWVVGQDPVWAAVSRFADEKTYAVTVLIVGACQCHVGEPDERAIDLSDDAFRQLYDTTGPDPGLIHVTIQVPVQGPTLPATDQ